MRVKIEIDCDTIGALTTHLSVIRSEVKKRAREMKLNPMEDELPKSKWQDDNCYGEHIVSVKLL